MYKYLIVTELGTVKGQGMTVQEALFTAIEVKIGFDVIHGVHQCYFNRQLDTLVLAGDLPPGDIYRVVRIRLLQILERDFRMYLFIRHD